MLDGIGQCGAKSPTNRAAAFVKLETVEDVIKLPDITSTKFPSTKIYEHQQNLA